DSDAGITRDHSTTTHSAHTPPALEGAVSILLICVGVPELIRVSGSEKKMSSCPVFFCPRASFIRIWSTKCFRFVFRLLVLMAGIRRALFPHPLLLACLSSQAAGDETSGHQAEMEEMFSPVTSSNDPVISQLDKYFGYNVAHHLGHLHAYDASLPSCEPLVAREVEHRAPAVDFDGFSAAEVKGLSGENRNHDRSSLPRRILQVQIGRKVAQQISPTLNDEARVEDAPELPPVAVTSTVVNHEHFLRSDFIPVLKINSTTTTRPNVDISLSRNAATVAEPQVVPVSDHLTWFRLALADPEHKVGDLEQVFRSTDRYHAIVVDVVSSLDDDSENQINYAVDAEVNQYSPAAAASPHAAVEQEAATPTRRRPVVESGLLGGTTGLAALLGKVLHKAQTFCSRIILRVSSSISLKRSSTTTTVSPEPALQEDAIVSLKREVLKMGGENATGCVLLDHEQLPRGTNNIFQSRYYFAVSLNMNAWSHTKHLAERLLQQRAAHADEQSYNRFGPPYLGMSPVTTLFMYVHREMWKKLLERQEMVKRTTSSSEVDVHQSDKIDKVNFPSAAEGERLAAERAQPDESRYHPDDFSPLDHNEWGMVNAFYTLPLAHWTEVQRLRDLESKYGDGCGRDDLTVNFVAHPDSRVSGDFAQTVVDTSAAAVKKNEEINHEAPPGATPAATKPSASAGGQHEQQSSPQVVGKVTKTAVLLGGDRMRNSFQRGCKSHNYAPHYVRHLWHLVKRTKPFAVIEVGVLRGSGLAMWSDFFRGNAEVHGFDLETKFAFENRKYLVERGAFGLVGPDERTSENISAGESSVSGPARGPAQQGEVDDDSVTSSGPPPCECATRTNSDKKSQDHHDAFEFFSLKKYSVQEHLQVPAASQLEAAADACAARCSRLPLDVHDQHEGRPASDQNNVIEVKHHNAPYLYKFDQTTVSQTLINRVEQTLSWPAASSTSSVIGSAGGSSSSTTSVSSRPPVLLVIDDGKHDSQTAWITFRTFIGLLSERTSQQEHRNQKDDEKLPWEDQNEFYQNDGALSSSPIVGDETGSSSTSRRSFSPPAAPWVYVIEDCMCNTFVFLLQQKRPDLFIYKYWNGHNSDLIFIQPTRVEDQKISGGSHWSWRKGKAMYSSTVV
ncbi:unnamed protein product, partial [Amoebophrya sp. A120]